MSMSTPPAWLGSCLAGLGLTKEPGALTPFERALRDELLALLRDGPGGYRPGDGARQSLHLLRALQVAAASGASPYRCQRAELGLLLCWRLREASGAWDAATMPAPPTVQRCLQALRASEALDGNLRSVADQLAATPPGGMPAEALQAFLALASHPQGD